MSNTFLKLFEMQHFSLKGQVRQASNKAAIKAFRRQGLVPCNLYGNGIDNVLFTVDAKELKGLTNTPSSFIVDLTLDNGQAFMAVLHELQFHPISDNCLHVDFLAVSADKPVAIDVPVSISGHSIGVRQGGKFIQRSRTLRVSGLMDAIPDELPVDITDLGLDKAIRAADLQYDGINIVSNKGTVVCMVKSTRNSAAAAAAEAAE